MRILNDHEMLTHDENCKVVALGLMVLDYCQLSNTEDATMMSACPRNDFEKLKEILKHCGESTLQKQRL